MIRKKLKFLIRLILTATLAFSATAQGENQSVYYKVETYPNKISSNCRGGVAKIYDECSSQMPILHKAIKRANETGKSVLLVYGAEWCIWCHVFDKYINGQSRMFQYKFEYDGEMQDWNLSEHENPSAEKEARALNKYVADNFVIAHIESYYSPDGEEVLRYIGFNKDKVTFVPYIFSLHRSGKYAAHMLATDAIPGLEVRHDSGHDYRGFDRRILLSELVKLRQKAKLKGSNI